MAIQNKLRQSNIELLRILSMLIIVMSHYLFNGVRIDGNTMTVYSVFCKLFSCGGIGVICFVLISAYFLVDIVEIKWKKIFTLWASLFVYSVSISIVIYFLNPEIGISTILKCMFPVGTRQWWFASTYIIFYIFVPYVNRFIKTIDQNSFKKLLLVMSILWVVLPTLIRLEYGANDIIYFLYLYLLGAYIKLYPLKNEKRVGVLLFAVGFSIIFASIVSCQFIGQYIPKFFEVSGIFNSWTQLPQIIEAVGIFLIFKNIKVSCNAFCNTVAASTFNVYLLHDHPLMRELLWKNFFNGTDYVGRPLFFVHFTVSVMIVFIVGIILGWCYKHTVEKFIIKIYDKISNRYSKNLLKR